MTSSPPVHIALCASRFNETVTAALVEGALSALREGGVNVLPTDIHWVPGALELPLMAKALCAVKRHDAVLALGCVIKGETAHFDVVVRESAHFLALAGFESGIPVLNGVLTVQTLDQALERSRPDSRNKGREVAQAALDTLKSLARVNP